MASSSTSSAAPVASVAAAAAAAAAAASAPSTAASGAAAASAASAAHSSTGDDDVPGALEVAPLVQQNLSTRRELEEWIAAQRKSLQREKAAHEQLRQERARQTIDAQRKREALQQQQKALAASVHEKESEVSAHQVEIEVLQAEKSKKEPILKELFLRNQEEDQKLRLLVNESTEAQTAQERQLAELQQGLAMYQRLGLFFEHTGAHQIVVRFTQIDPAEPNRVFSFRIRIDPVTDRFLVDECNESVASFDELVEDLNTTGDLAFFVRSMRRQFKKLV